MSATRPWPDYCRKETLAKRLDLAVGAIDQYVKRGLLPRPKKIGDALLWKWAEVDAMMTGVADGSDLRSDTAVDNPYRRGSVHGPQTTAPRQTSDRPQ